MNTALSQENLEKLLDAAVREVTEKTTGIQLFQGGKPPSEDFCTVHIAFRKGFRSSLSLCADTSILTSMAQNAIDVEEITSQDMEDFVMEYFNVLCGRIAALFYRATKMRSRFSVPAFYRGRFEPEGQRRQFVLNYSNSQSQSVQLIHHVPHPAQEEEITTPGLI